MCPKSAPWDKILIRTNIFFGIYPKKQTALHFSDTLELAQHGIVPIPYYNLSCWTFICVWYNQITSKDWGASPSTLTCPFGMDDPLRDSLTVKVGHFVCEDHILDQQGTLGSCSLQIQFVPNGMPPSCGQSIWPLFQTK